MSAVLQRNTEKKSMKITSTIGRSLEIPLRIFGIWPGTPYVSFCRCFWTIVLVTAQYFQYQHTIKNLYTADLSNLMDGLSATLSFTLLFVRLIIFWLNQRTFKKVLAMMAIDWKKTSGIDSNIMINNATLSHNFSNFMCFFQSMAVIMHSGLAINEGINKRTNITTRPFIIQMDIPLRSDSQVVYGFIMIAQFFYLLLSSIALGMINVLLIVLILHVVGQIDILRRWLTEILFSEENGYKPSLIIIKQIIKKHQSIINFSENIENLYSRIALILFVSDTLILCFVGFVLVILIRAPNNNNLIIFKILAFYIVLNVEAFIYCFAGEYISAKSKMIVEAAYNSHWYQSASQDSRIILLLMMRSQNKLTITIGKFMDLSLERFASIIKASASYVSVMLAMY